LLIGINYRAELKGCINDVYNLKQYLTQDRRWPDDPNSIVILTDDSPNPVFQPTKQNIIEAMRWLASCNNYGDSLFLHYSGHGGQKQDASGINLLRR
jgi:metacaspase-1